MKTKKIIKILLSISIMVCLLFSLFGGNAQAYESQNIGSNKLYSSGYFYLGINGGPNGNSKVKVNITHTGTMPTYSSVLTKPSGGWKVSLGGGTNVHNIKIKTTSNITTKTDNGGRYIVFVFQFTYDMPAHYQWQSRRYDEPSWDARLNFREWAANNSDGKLTDSATGGHATSTTTRTCTFQVSMHKCGIRTYSKGRYWAAAYMNIGKANRTITWVNGLGTTLKTQTVADGGAGTPPATPTRTGYNFAGWSGSYAAPVCSNRTITATWTPWKHTVAYNANGGSGAPAAQTKTYGSTLTLSSTKPTRTGYTFAGWNTNAAGTGTNYSAGGQYGADQNGGTATLYAKWTINSYSNSISHWMFGFKNGEGNNSNKQAWLIGSTNFAANYNSSFYMNNSRAKTVPNGFQLSNSFGTSSISGNWTSYSMGTSVTQKPNAMSFEYDYRPNTYTITYNLDGGTNSPSNPSTYNVLYGVTLANPTKVGYKFAGWYNGNTKVTGINQGANATFTSETDMYNKLKTRTTGNVTLTAKWKPIPIIDVPNFDDIDLDNNAIPPFLDGNNIVIQLGDTFTPLKYVKATDAEDGDISDKIVIKSMTLPLINNVATTSGTFTVTYSVTNSSGTSTEKTITVIVNQPPEINGPKDRYILEDTPINDAFILDKIIFTDKEDGNIHDKGLIDKIVDKEGNVVDKIDSSSPEDWIITIKVTDSYKKTETEDYIIHIVDDKFKYSESHNTNFRFISKEMLSTLNSSSVYKTNTYLNDLLQNSLNKTKNNAQKIITFTQENIRQVKSFQKSTNNQRTRQITEIFINAFQ